jgi:hypothetical protein
MNNEIAELVVEMLYSAGYMDDGDEIILDLLDMNGIAVTKQKVKALDGLVRLINPKLPNDQKLREGLFGELLDELIEEQESCGTVLKK